MDKSIVYLDVYLTDAQYASFLDLAGRHRCLEYVTTETPEETLRKNIEAFAGPSASSHLPPGGEAVRPNGAQGGSSVKEAAAASSSPAPSQLPLGDAGPPPTTQERVSEREETIIAGTYNVCWDCMQGHAPRPGQTSSAAALATRCAAAKDRVAAEHSPCLVQAAKNIDAHFQGAAFVGLQESSLWRELRSQSAVLRRMNYITHATRLRGGDEATLLYSSSYGLLWEGKGFVYKPEHRSLRERPRPIVVALFEELRSGRRVLVTNVHNVHVNRTARGRVIQEALRDVPGIEGALRELPATTLLICMGDWNDKQGALQGFAPFALCPSLLIKDVTVRSVTELPLTCCSTRNPPGYMPSPGDYVLSNYPVENEVIAFPEGPDASDHFPVRAKIYVQQRGGGGPGTRKLPEVHRREL